MNKYEFKLNYYFNIYKNTCVVKSQKFKKKFIDKHGEFPLLDELQIMIEKYQIKKYGSLLEPSENIVGILKKGAVSSLAREREKARFGTKNERNLRKIKYDRENKK